VCGAYLLAHIHKQYDVNEDREIWDEYYKQELFGTRKAVVPSLFQLLLFQQF
jgi:hypothetical protein